MLIPENILISYGAQFEDFKRGETIFEEGDTPKYYYQIASGRIKLNHYNEDGKELILAILPTGLSVCELLLFIDQKFPVNAISLEPSRILKVPKAQFLRLLDDHIDVAKNVTKFLAERLYYKYIMLENNASLNAEVRIKGVLDYHKSFTSDTATFSYEVPFTRQNIASLTGLRVETVIRTIKKLEKQEVLKIVNRNIFY